MEAKGVAKSLVACACFFNSRILCDAKLSFLVDEYYTNHIKKNE